MGGRGDLTPSPSKLRLMKKNHWIAPLPSTKVPYMYFEKKIDIKFKLISVTVLQHTMSKKYCPFLYSEYYTIKIGQDFSVIMYRVGRGRNERIVCPQPNNVYNCSPHRPICKITPCDTVSRHPWYLYWIVTQK